MTAHDINEKVDRVVGWVESPLVTLGIISLVSSATLLFFGVIVRYIFLYTFPVVEDLAVDLIVWAVFLMGGPVFRRGGHIGMEFLSERFTGFARALQQLLLHLALLIACFILLWKGTEVVQLIYQIGKTTPSGELPEWLLMLPAPLGGALLGFYGIAGIIKIFCFMADRKISDAIYQPRMEE
jgi:TRAP-type C4-dicarboxylate transport system permease small subunit